MIKQRILTALVLVLSLGLAIFLLPADALAIVLGLLFVGGIWEWAGFFGIARGVGRLPYVALGATLIAVLFYFTRAGQVETLWLFGLAALWWLLAFIWVLVYPTRIPRWTVFVAGLVTLIPAWLALWRLRANHEHGTWLLIAVFVLVWAADTGAFFAGRRFGTHKLAPAVSPGKTWEGVAGGLLLALLVAALVARPLGHELVPFVMLCALVVAASVIGDLAVSLFKRGAGIKDSGRIFPGHGGILDRIDSLCAAAPVFALGLALLGDNV